MRRIEAHSWRPMSTSECSRSCGADGGPRMGPVAGLRAASRRTTKTTKIRHTPAGGGRAQRAARGQTAEAAPGACVERHWADLNFEGFDGSSSSRANGAVRAFASCTRRPPTAMSWTWSRCGEVRDAVSLPSCRRRHAGIAAQAGSRRPRLFKMGRAAPQPLSTEAALGIIIVE